MNNKTLKKVRDTLSSKQGDQHACPIIHSMYPTKSRGEMAREFAQLHSLGFDAALSHLHNNPKDLIEFKTVRNLITAIERRMNSDDVCEMPFDEDLAEALRPFNRGKMCKLLFFLSFITLFGCSDGHVPLLDYPAGTCFIRADAEFEENPYISRIEKYGKTTVLCTMALSGHKQPAIFNRFDFRSNAMKVNCPKELK